jgi:electron transfer flavoprotein alpha/beta subunit
VVANGSRAHAAAGPTTRTAVAQAAYRHAQAAYRHALAAGFDRAFLVGAGIAVLLLVIAIVAIRVRRADLNGS